MFQQRYERYIQQRLNFLNKQPELYNEKIIHNKVHYYKFNYYRIIPKGKKGILWITEIETNPFVFFIPTHNNRLLFSSIRQYNACFDKILTTGKGTILYGTNTQIKNTNYFCCENIYSFINETVVRKNWNEKLSILLDLLQEYTQQKHYTKHDIIISTPPIYKIQKGENILTNTYGLPYDLYSIQYLNKDYNSVYTKRFQHNDIKANFLIRPDIQNDIYKAYDKNNEMVGFLHIPDYKTSIMMNNIYRSIKENTNLDLLEESDDEDEFENIQPDKYVNLEKEHIFECLYNEKFNMWSPIKRIDERRKISDMEYIKYKLKK